MSRVLFKAADFASSIRSSFGRNRAGNVSIIFAFSSLIMFNAVGGAVDFARWHQAKNKMQAALDAATLAGARTIQISGAVDYDAAILMAKQYFSRMKPAADSLGEPTFEVIENGTVLVGRGTFDLKTSFLGVVGIPTLTAELRAEAVIAAGGNAGTNLEVSLMLDTTGSMAGQKIEDLKLAAKDLIDIVVWSDQSQYTSKVALAPFSSRVNVGDYLSKVTDVQEERNLGGGVKVKGITCVTERTGPEAFTDAKPVGLDTLSAYSGDTGNVAKTNIANYSADGQCTTGGFTPTEIPKILPLTNDKDLLKSHIEALPADGSTAGALGTAWAWYMLSPNWNGIWEGSSKPAPYSDITTLGPKGLPKLKKVAILMTDGIYNTKAGNNFGDASTEAGQISEAAVTLCTNMKAAGIKVYTIGFQLGGSQLAIDTLKACSSHNGSDTADHTGFYFSAESGSELRSAFRQIALQLSTLRLRS